MRHPAPRQIVCSGLPRHAHQPGADPGVQGKQVRRHDRRGEDDWLWLAGEDAPRRQGDGKRWRVRGKGFQRAGAAGHVEPLIHREAEVRPISGLVEVRSDALFSQGRLDAPDGLVNDRIDEELDGKRHKTLPSLRSPTLTLCSPCEQIILPCRRARGTAVPAHGNSSRLKSADAPSDPCRAVSLAQSLAQYPQCALLPSAVMWCHLLRGHRRTCASIASTAVQGASYTTGADATCTQIGI